MFNPTNANEREIKRRIDLKAQAVADGTGSWDSIIFEMKLTLPFVMSASDEKFLDEYVKSIRSLPSFNVKSAAIGH